MFHREVIQMSEKSLVLRRNEYINRASSHRVLKDRPKLDIRAPKYRLKLCFFIFFLLTN